MEREAAKAIDSYPSQIGDEQDLGHGLPEKSEPKANFLYQILSSDLPAQEKTKERIGQEA